MYSIGGIILAQEINQVGTITTTFEKSVIFKSRQIRDLTVTENENVTVRYNNISDDGEKQEMIVIPFQTFSLLVEESIWKLIDETIKK